MPTKEENNATSSSDSVDDESIKALEKGEGKKDIEALQLDVGTEHIRVRKRWWQLWMPARLPPPPPASLDDAKIIPFVSASLLSKLTYTWITPIMVLGYQRTLQATDLWKVGPEQEAGYLSEKLDAAWARRVDAAKDWNAGSMMAESLHPCFCWREVDGRQEASLAWALNDVLGHLFWIGGASKVLGDTSQLMGPILVKTIIRFATARAAAKEDGTEPPPLSHGIGMAIGLLCLVIMSSVFQHQFFWRSMTTGVLGRAALTASIYKRGSTPLTAVHSLTPSLQVSRLDACAQWFHAGEWFRNPDCQALIRGLFSVDGPNSSYNLSNHMLTQLGPSALAGFSLFLIVIPISNAIMARQYKIRGVSMKFTDRRAKVLLEVLSSMRVVKYFCYEVPFLKQIFDIRNKEINGIRKIQHAQSGNIALAWSLPVLASTLAFVTYTRVIPGFDIAIIFSSFSLFQLLRQPMMFLPRALSNIADARNALKRLALVFHAEIRTDVPFKTDFSQDETKSAPETKASAKLKAEDADSQDDPPFRVQNVEMRILAGPWLALSDVWDQEVQPVAGLIGEMRWLSGEFSFGGKVAYCPQTAWIQNASLRDNVLFGRPFDSDRYWDIMETACLLPDLQLLPDGDLTEIGEKGINLSGGQKQEYVGPPVNIARALYYDADIVIMDDPLSAVDANVTHALIFSPIAITYTPLRADEFLSMGLTGTSRQEGKFGDYYRDGGGLEKEIADAAGTGKIEGKLITKEIRTTGSVSWRVYATYIKAGEVLGMQGCQIANSYTLVWWQENKFDKPFSFYQILYAALGISQAMLTFLMGAGIDLLSMAAAKSLHHTSVENILYAPMSFFDTIPMGRIIGIFGRDIDTIDNPLSMSLRMFVLVMSNMTSAVILISVLEHYFLIAAFAIAFGYSYFAAFYRASAQTDAMLRSVLYAHLAESLTGLPTIRSYGEIPVTNQRWLAIRLDACGSIMVFTVAIFAVIGLSGISPAEIGLILTYTTQLTQNCGVATRQSAELENYMNSVERVVHYSRKDLIPQEAAYESDKDHKPPAGWPSRGVVEFKDVEMRYRPGLPKVLHGISMNIHAGEKIGVVGRTGAGKSSLALTLLRIVEYSGTILVDGGTVRSVLDPFGRYEDARLWDALRRSFLVDSGTSTPISSLEHGEQTQHRIDLDTVVEIDGANLSVGERSLLSLARALVKDSKVVVLDEATASVDLETDHKIQTTIQTQFKHNTLLCIAHRLRTIISYDRILVLEAGKIAEFDTPLTLFNRPDSIFRSLCEKSNISSADIEKSTLYDRD
ncbi:hypothetical protein K438DRAFT_1962751 [Mycena galopus ATCC 62051]|nr:hypothetical protein K438DRAFT_1962751 [Mycena galopus ATCC 62051]